MHWWNTPYDPYRNVKVTRLVGTAPCTTPACTKLKLQTSRNRHQ